VLFRLKPNVGTHVEGRGASIVTYRAGDVVESDKDLAAKFPHKFERIAEIKPVAAPSQQAPAQAEAAAVVPETAPDKPASKPKGKPGRPKGQDVTAQFSGAAEKDLKIVLRDDLYVVYDADRPTVVLDNFETKDALTEWLSKQ